jgi:hypothetical protein
VAAPDFVQRLCGCDSFPDEPFDASELRFIDTQLRLGSVNFRLRPFDLFRPGSALQLEQPRLCRLECRLGLLKLRTVFAIFKPYDDLIALDAIALFNSDPADPAGDLRADLDFVVRDDVAGRHEYRRLRGAFLSGTHNFYRDSGRHTPVNRRPRQNDADKNENDNNDLPSTLPWRFRAFRLINLQLVQFV